LPSRLRPVIESILPWFTSAITTIMPFFATNDLTALLRSSNGLSDAIVTRSPLNDVFEAAKARLTIAPSMIVRECE